MEVSTPCEVSVELVFEVSVEDVVVEELSAAPVSVEGLGGDDEAVEESLVACADVSEDVVVVALVDVFELPLFTTAAVF